MNKTSIVSELNLNKIQVDQIDFYLDCLIKNNKHTNLIGKSTIDNIWDRHVLDCLQLTQHISNKKLRILDMGTGAGLPGLLLSIIGYKKVLMVDSVKKKTDFVRKIIKELSLSAKVHNKRIEKPPISQHDVIVSRALAPLVKLITYARVYSNKNTTLLFLKGRNANSEIEISMKAFSFDLEKFKSLSSGDGCVLKIKNIKNKSG